IKDSVGLSPSVGGIVATSDGGFALCGVIAQRPGGPDFDIYIGKFDPAGKMQWNYSHITLFANQIISTIAEISGSDLVVAGEYSISHSSDTIGLLFIRMSSNGDLKEANILKIPNTSSYASAIAGTHDGGFAIAGVIGRKSVVSDPGALLLLKQQNQNNVCNLIPTPTSVSQTGIITDAPFSQRAFNLQESSFPAMSIDHNDIKEYDLCNGSNVHESTNEFPIFSISPNPKHLGGAINLHFDQIMPAVNFEVCICDLIGNIFVKEQINLNEKQDFSFDISRLGSGAYLVELWKPNRATKIFSAKLIKE
ncbi:MAG: hypothetical protein ACHQM6_01030, partial [Candidatus Kapaibacterium sp.]